MFFPVLNSFFASDYCVLDLETTGLRPAQAEILEVGILKIRGGNPVAKMSVLVCPHTLPVPAKITDLTGITTDMVKNGPSIEELSYWIYDFIGTDPILGYNVQFDLSFLQAHTTKHTPPNSSLDVLPLAQICFPDRSSHSLSSMTEYLHLYQNTHRALDDCVATWQLYELCKSFLEEKEYDDKQIRQEIQRCRAQRKARRHGF